MERTQRIGLHASLVKLAEAETEAREANKRLAIAQDSLRDKQRRIKRPPLKPSLLTFAKNLQKKTRLEQARTAVRMIHEWEKRIAEEFNSSKKDHLQEEMELFLSSLTTRY